MRTAQQPRRRRFVCARGRSITRSGLGETRGRGEALFNPPAARPPEGKNAPQEGTEKEVGRDF